MCCSFNLTGEIDLLKRSAYFPKMTVTNLSLCGTGLSNRIFFETIPNRRRLRDHVVEPHAITCTTVRGLEGDSAAASKSEWYPEATLAFRNCVSR